MAKKPQPVLSPDELRDRILRYLFDRHSTARGPAKIPIGNRDLQRELKQRHGMTQQEVSSNLDYLVQVGWVREVVKEGSFETERGMKVSQEQVRFKISDVGINHLQSATIFRKPNAGLNITNVQGVTVVGDGNVVNTQFTEVSRALDELQQAVEASNDISDSQKLDASADISAIRAQIAKQRPSAEVIGAAWSSLQGIATVAGVVDAASKIRTLFGPLLGITA